MLAREFTRLAASIASIGASGRCDPSTTSPTCPSTVTIIAKQLHSAGYATGMFGKWHLGQQAKYHPGQRGFDEAIVSAGRHFKFDTDPKTDYPKGEYLADFLTDKAVDFITRHKDQPFFLYLPHFGVHSPYQAKDELIAKFQPKPGVGGHNDPTYAAMISSVDESVGRVMKTLDDLKLADNTVLIFTSDNGGVGGYVREGIKTKGDVTDNYPLRSGKGSLYEGGNARSVHRAVAGCHQARLDLQRAGHSCRSVSDDAGACRAASQPRQVLDGESLVKLFRDSNASLQRDAIFQHFPGYLGAGRGFLADDSGQSGSDRRLEADGVSRRRSPGTLQSQQRHRRNRRTWPTEMPDKSKGAASTASSPGEPKSKLRCRPRTTAKRRRRTKPSARGSTRPCETLASERANCQPLHCRFSKPVHKSLQPLARRLREAHETHFFAYRIVVVAGRGARSRRIEAGGLVFRPHGAAARSRRARLGLG